jgi:repressor LexA
MSAGKLSNRQQKILQVIERHIAERGYPPSVREIGDAVGLASASTVHAHLTTLERLGYLRRDPTKPRAIEIRHDAVYGTTERRPTRLVPLVGDVAAGTNVLAQENIEELMPLPADFTGPGELFMLRVRGDSMIDAAVLDGDYVVARAQQFADPGDMVVAGLPDGEATVKFFNKKKGKVVLNPANERLSPMEYSPGQVTIFGRVVSIMRRL